MPSQLSNRLITYNIQFSDQVTWQHVVSVGTPEATQDSSNAAWTKLNFEQCPHCPLTLDEHGFCPLAKGLAPLIEGCNGRCSHDPVDVRIEARGRTTLQHTSLQRALSSLMGAVCANSRCPYTDVLKPMLWFHQPLSHSDETLFRVLSTYLLAQHLKKLKGQESDWDLTGLRTAYSNLRQVNLSLSKRIRKASEQDAGVNGLILLDLLASDVLSLLDSYEGELDDFFQN